MNTIATELNDILKGTQAEKLLSEFGRRLFFPKGIIAQSTEAGEKAHKHNATAGMAFKDSLPLILESIETKVNGIEPKDYITYAPTPGDKELRELWLKEIKKKNPSLGNTHTSLPMVVPGLTSGICNTADLFIDKGDNIVIPDLHWGNYNLIFDVRKEANIKSFPFFSNGKINLEGLKDTLLSSAKNNKISLLLNFPNNPTGYSPSQEEAKGMAKVIKEVAEEGINVLAITDDAYFGLFYEDNIYKESIFSLLADLHENVLAVKVDGATKEDYVWGLRIGFITFAGKGLNNDHTYALEQKLMGSIRSSLSSSSKLSQTLVKNALKSETYSKNKQAFEDLMRARYIKVKEILNKRVKGSKLKELPFNSGYFMTFTTPKGFNEQLRQELLKHGIGTIALGDHSFRIAYSSVDIEKLEDLYNTIFSVSDGLL